MVPVVVKLNSKVPIKKADMINLQNIPKVIINKINIILKYSKPK